MKLRGICLPLPVADEGKRGGVIACPKAGGVNPAFSAKSKPEKGLRAFLYTKTLIFSSYTVLFIFPLHADIIMQTDKEMVCW
jgi:hypothetical protein